MSRRRTRAAAAVLTGSVLVAPLTLGAARSPGSVPAGLCLPLITSCASPSPSATTGPTPTPTPTPTSGLLPGTGTLLPGLSTDPTSTASPTPTSTTAPTQTATPSPSATSTPTPTPNGGTTIFTKNPASMSSATMSFTNLSSISVVTLPTADGTGVNVLKITADAVSTTGFKLTVRPPDGPALVTTADTMELRGHVSVYVSSVTATTIGGLSLTFGTVSPPPQDAVSSGLLGLTIGLIGSTADSITYTNTNQRIVVS